MDEKPNEEENERNDQEEPLFELLDGRLVLRGLYKQLSETDFIEVLNKKFDIAGSNVSGTIDSMRLMLEQLEQEKASPTMEDFTYLKNATARLDAQFADFKSQTIDFMKDNVEFLMAATEAKGAIATHEKRLTKLENDAERKRNWRVNGWLLALTIISTLAAVWALFLR